MQLQPVYISNGAKQPAIKQGYYITPVFAVHWETDESDIGWGVTHVPTGMSAGRKIKQWEDAVELASMLSAVPGAETGEFADSTSMTPEVLMNLGTVYNEFKHKHPYV